MGMGVTQIPGGSQTERRTHERESENKESEDLGHSANKNMEMRDLSSETCNYPQQSEELAQSPSQNPVDLDYEPLTHPSSTVFSPDQTYSMSTPLSASASKAKPSFVKMHSRSISIDLPEDEGGASSAAAASASSLNHHGFSTQSPSATHHHPSHPQQPQPHPSATRGGGDKANALMEELSKLQSAVESYSIKRRERESQPEDTQVPFSGPSPTPPSHSHSRSRSRSRSPSPSPTKESPGKSFESLSPLPSPISLIQSPGMESPESPDSQFPQPRKAIVVNEQELDEYKSSTDEESESDSDEERKVVAVSEAVSFYDHSPGEVYTIPEEEDEGGSPTGGDLVTSLNRPGECMQ